MQKIDDAIHNKLIENEKVNVILIDKTVRNELVVHVSRLYGRRFGLESPYTYMGYPMIVAEVEGVEVY